MSVKPKRGSSIALHGSAAEMRGLFGTNLRQLRLKAKLTQVELARRTGIQQHYISEIENGLHNITLDTMTALAGAVGADVRTMFRTPRQRRRSKEVSGPTSRQVL